MMVRVGLAFLFLLAVCATSANADRYRDCFESRNLKQQIKGCSQIIKRKARESEDNRATAYFNRGRASYIKGAHKRAIADYTEAIRFGLEDAETYNNRGAAHKANGDFSQAIADYSQAIKIKPENASAYYNRGLAYVSNRQYDRAISDYTKAITFEPDDSDIYSSRGLVFEKTGKREAAIADYRKATELNPGNGAATSGLMRYGVTP